MDINGIYREVGLRVEKRRRMLKITQEELANLIGLTRTSITNIESGKQRCTLDTLYRIATSLRVSLIELLPDEEIVTTGFRIEPLYEVCWNEVLKVRERSGRR